MVSTPSEPTWAVTFPGNLRWSNATQIVKGMVPYNNTSAGQIDRVARRMQARHAAGEDQDTIWREEWSRMAQWNERQADAARRYALEECAKRTTNCYIAVCVHSWAG